jgi:hypothetical protein
MCLAGTLAMLSVRCNAGMMLQCIRMVMEVARTRRTARLDALNVGSVQGCGVRGRSCERCPLSPAPGCALGKDPSNGERLVFGESILLGLKAQLFSGFIQDEVHCQGLHCRELSPSFLCMYL